MSGAAIASIGGTAGRLGTRLQAGGIAGPPQQNCSVTTAELKGYCPATICVLQGWITNCITMEKNCNPAVVTRNAIVSIT